MVFRKDNFQIRKDSIETNRCDKVMTTRRQTANAQRSGRNSLSNVTARGLRIEVKHRQSTINERCEPSHVDGFLIQALKELDETKVTIPSEIEDAVWYRAKASGAERS